MDQLSLYRTVNDAGCTVLVFEDHPQFFGNWRVTFKRGEDIFEAEADNREGWLTLWRQLPGGTAERVHETRMPRAGEKGPLDVLGAWLQQLQAAGNQA